MTQPCTHRAVSTRYKGQRPSNAFAALPLSEIQLAAPTLRSHTLHRPRLTAHLDHGNGQRVTTIVAPAGYGKTIAAADWLASSTGLDATHGGSGRAAWLTLTAAENDPIRFWRYAVAALERVQPAFHTASWNMRTTSTIDMLQVALLNDMAHAPDDLTLILDDYNLITTDAIHHSLAFLIDHAPPQFHLMLLSRSEPPLPMARWRASDELAELQAADLRFTDIETNALINKQLGLNVAPDLVAMLHDRTAGWATALRLVAHAIGTTRDAYGTVVHLSGAQHDIRTYLEDEVLSHQPPEIRAFLLMTSVADWLSVEVCDAIRSAFDRAWSAATDSATHAPAPTSAPLSSADLLEHVERAGLFLHPIDPERHSYRYHPLFAQMLRYRLHQEFPDMEGAIHRSIATLYPHGELFHSNGVEHSARQSTHEVHHTDPTPADAHLSEREHDVLDLLAGGLSNEEIARTLLISTNTVKMHIRHIYDKLDVHNRVQAIRQAHVHPITE